MEDRAAYLWRSCVNLGDPYFSNEPSDRYHSSIHSSLSPSGRFLLAGLIQSNMHVYNVSRRELVGRFPDSGTPTTSRFAMKTAFIDRGTAVVSGTESGSVCIWDRKSGDLLQELPHQGTPFHQIFSNTQCAHQIFQMRRLLKYV